MMLLSLSVFLLWFIESLGTLLEAISLAVFWLEIIESLGVLWWVVYWVFCGGPYTGCLVAGRVLGVLCKSCERYLVQAQKGT